MKHEGPDGNRPGFSVSFRLLAYAACSLPQTEMSAILDGGAPV